MGQAQLVCCSSCAAVPQNVAHMLENCFAGGSKGFFDNAIGSEFAKRSPAPAKPAPKQSTPTRSTSGGGFFDNAIGSEFAKRSPAPSKPAPKQSAPRTSGKCSYKAPDSEKSCEAVCHECLCLPRNAAWPVRRRAG